MNIPYIYIIHYKPLINRRKYIENYFNSNQITNYEFRDHYQRENLTKELAEFYCTKPLTPPYICITIEHIETYKEIIKQNFDGWVLILEDDAIFCDNFINRINEYLDYVPADADYLDISDYLIRFYIPNPQGKWTKLPHTRTNIGYLIKRQTCEKILQTIIPFNEGIDHELNKQIKLHNLNVYHIDEPLILIGHHYGSSHST